MISNPRNSILVLAVAVFATSLLAGCKDANDDKTVAKPPPADVKPVTKGPEELAAERRAARRANGAPGVHANGGEGER